MKWFSPALFALFINGGALKVSATADDPPVTALPVLRADGGRYVFGQTGMAARNTWMLDTKTGRLWRLAEDPKAGETFLIPVTYILRSGEKSLEPIDIAKEVALWVEDEQRKAAAATAAPKAQAVPPVKFDPSTARPEPQKKSR